MSYIRYFATNDSLLIQLFIYKPNWRTPSIRKRVGKSQKSQSKNLAEKKMLFSQTTV